MNPDVSNSALESKRFRFNECLDLQLAREVYGLNPYENVKNWGVVQLNFLQITGKTISIRTLRDRIENLVGKYLKKVAALELRSGIENPVSELDELLQNIADILRDFKEKKNYKKKQQIENKSSYSEGFKDRDSASLKYLEPDQENESENIENELIESEEMEVTLHNANELKERKTEETEETNKEGENEDQKKESNKRRSGAHANILMPLKRRRAGASMKQHTIQYLEKKMETQINIRNKELILAERKQALEEKKFELNRREVEKQIELNERKLRLEELKMEKQFDLFSCQHELIKLVLRKFD